MPSASSAPFVVRPLTAALWPALEDLFGKAGASNGCWCMYWRIGPAYRHHRARNRRALKSLARAQEPIGLLAFDGERAVGWCQLTPIRSLAWLTGSLEKSKLVADSDTWAIS